MTKTHTVDDDAQNDIHPGERKTAPRDDVVADGLTANKADNQSPGEMLREARLAHDMSVADLCGLTMLSRRAVEALEDNRFDELPQPVFVRGYYRKCAKLLELDSERLLNAYASSGGARVGVTPAPAGGRIRVVPADVTPTRRRSFGFVLLILILIVAGLAGYLYWSQNMRGDTATNATSGINLMQEFGDDDTATGSDSSINLEPQNDAATTPDASGSTTAMAAAAPTKDSSGLLAAGAAPVPVAAGHNAADGAKQAAANVDDGEQTAVAETPATTTAAVDGGSGSGVSNATTADTTGQTTATTANASSDDAATSAAASVTALTIQFDARSWIDVHDAAGAQLLVGIYEDTTRTVDGVPPYELVVGYAPGVSVRYHGQAVAFDVAGNNTARFSVGTGNS